MLATTLLRRSRSRRSASEDTRHPWARRAALSSVAIILVICVVLALGIWTLIGSYDPKLTGAGGNQMLSARILIFLALGLFAVVTAVWSRIRRKRDEEL
jgi:quinol-cytochrome oxidoreductase complex cytochrome b subunit